MHLIDGYAYSNALRILNPVYKAGFSLFLILFSLLAKSIPISLASVGLTLFLSVTAAHLPLRAVLRLLFAESVFLFFGVLGVAISISTQLNPASGSFNGFTLELTRNSLNEALNLFLRALSCAAAMNFLTMTTPTSDLIYLMQQARLPCLLIELMTLIYRFIWTTAETFERMVRAKEARLGFRSIRTTFRSLGEIAASLFIQTFRKSQRVQLALDSRLANGAVRVLPPETIGLMELLSRWRNGGETSRA